MKIEIKDPSERTFGELQIGDWFRGRGRVVFIKASASEGITIPLCPGVYMMEAFTCQDVIEPLKNVQIMAEVGMEP